MQSSRHQLGRQQRIFSNLTCSCSCSSTKTSTIRWRRSSTALEAVASRSSNLDRRSFHPFSTARASATASSSAGVGLLQGPSKRPLESFFKHNSLARKVEQAQDTRSAEDKILTAEASHLSTPTPTTSTKTPLPPSSPNIPDVVIPPIATPTSAWRALDSPKSLRAQLSIYKQLAKGRLSAWVVLTSMVGYAMCPTDPAAAALAMEALVQDTFGTATVTSALTSSLDTTAAANTFRVTTLLATAAGTGLCSASANTFNQLIEIPYDAQMPRTQKRPLPSHLITPLHAFTFGSLSGIGGLALLASVNPLTASLGLLNIVLYAAVYTPLKRLSVVNTWIGAIVGGIPPLMGWAACTNSLDPFSGQAGAWVLATILFAWQFPHFNALSWTIRSEYARGGYRMLSAVNPGMNARVSLRWSLACGAAAAVGAPLVGLTSWTVGLVTLIPSAPLALYAWRFWRAGSTKSLQAAKQYGVMNTVKGARATDRDPRDASARSLFFVSLVHLPLLLAVMMVGNVLESWLASRREESDNPVKEQEEMAA